VFFLLPPNRQITIVPADLDADIPSPTVDRRQGDLAGTDERINLTCAGGIGHNELFPFSSFTTPEYGAA